VINQKAKKIRDYKKVSFIELACVEISTRKIESTCFYLKMEISRENSRMVNLKECLDFQTPLLILACHHSYWNAGQPK